MANVVLTRKSVIIFLFSMIFAGFAAFFAKKLFSKRPESALPILEQNLAGGDCVYSVEEKIVRGNSLSPLIESGQRVTVFLGYYDCNEIKREDIVLYSFAGSQNPLIKIIKGIPGDKFKLQQVENGWHILINDKILKNSEGIPYLVSGKRYEMLALYEKSYKGKIPDGAYLLLGNIPTGTTDSTRFGLIDKSDILGKVEY